MGVVSREYVFMPWCRLSADLKRDCTVRPLTDMLVVVLLLPTLFTLLTIALSRIRTMR
jgi:hypothetical protein